MKKLNYLLICVLALIFSSCSISEESDSYHSESHSESHTQTRTKTEVVLYIITSDNTPKSGYTVWAFDKKFDPESTAPVTPIKTAISDTQGIAKFDFENEISDSKTLYFEAFLENNGSYTLESITRTKLVVKKGYRHKTAIIVK